MVKGLELDQGVPDESGELNRCSSNHNNNNNNGGRIVRSLVVKSLCVLGAAFLLRKLTKTTTRWDHAGTVAQALTGEKDMAEHLMSVYLTCCKRGERCLYEGSTPPNGFPNAWNGATYCTSKLSILRNGEVHAWDQGYDDEGNQVWGVKAGPYEFKPSTLATFGAHQNLELLNYNGKRLEETPN